MFLTGASTGKVDCYLHTHCIYSDSLSRGECGQTLQDVRLHVAQPQDPREVAGNVHRPFGCLPVSLSHSGESQQFLSHTRRS